jgi:O-antigen ligase
VSVVTTAARLGDEARFLDGTPTGLSGPAPGMPLRVRGAWAEWVVAAAVVGLVGIVTVVLVRLDPARLGVLLFVGASALLVVALGLRSPLMACAYLLVTTFFRLAIPTGTLPVDPFLLAFVGVLAATWLWLRPWERPLSDLAVDPIEIAMGLYIGWNLLSMMLPHAYPAGQPLDPAPFSLSRFVLIGVVIPLTTFMVGRRVFVTERALRFLLWSVLVAAAYSAAVSILAFTAPQFVWPTYMLHNTTWPGRAVGVFNTPVVNGLVLIYGYVIAIHVAAHRRERPFLRGCAALVGVAAVFGIYFTHTRAVWLSFVLVVLIGALVAKGFRAAYVVTALAIVGLVVTYWSTFTSADRAAGGVGSPGEVEDRLNTIATSIWAFVREPITGWGIGRFAEVNTYHHQQWSPSVPWERGFGIPSHLDGLGVLVELGVVGFVLWLGYYVLLYTRLLAVARRMPVRGTYGRPLVLTALLCLTAQVITGLTVDLRFFDFPNIVVMLLAGAAIGWQHHQAPTPSPRRATSASPMPGHRVPAVVPA